MPGNTADMGLMAGKDRVGRELVDTAGVEHVEATGGLGASEQTWA